MRQRGPFPHRATGAGPAYTCEMFRGTGMYAGIAFENVVLEPGETRDLGDIRSGKPVDIRGK